MYLAKAEFAEQAVGAFCGRCEVHGATDPGAREAEAEEVKRTEDGEPIDFKNRIEKHMKTSGLKRVLRDIYLVDIFNTYNVYGTAQKINPTDTGLCGSASISRMMRGSLKRVRGALWVNLFNTMQIHRSM